MRKSAASVTLDSSTNTMSRNTFALLVLAASLAVVMGAMTASRETWVEQQ
ncbi:MAG: hypothetical protein HS120_02190 [Burkholderiales bacterium]|nr:hypothetical protein [Burkholderiales bacterium]